MGPGGRHRAAEGAWAHWTPAERAVAASAFAHAGIRCEGTLDVATLPPKSAMPRPGGVFGSAHRQIATREKRESVPALHFGAA